MGKKNITFTKDGMRVGVKQARDEDYEDKTQRCGNRESRQPPFSLEFPRQRLMSIGGIVC